MTARRSIAAAVLCAALSAGAGDFGNRFTYGDGIVFYFANRDGRPFTLALKGRESIDNPVLIRVYDPEERRLFRLDRHADTVPAGKGEPFEDSVSVPARGPGVYQVAVSGFRGTVEIATEPRLPFGVYGTTQYLCGQGTQFADTYVHMPPGLSSISVVCEEALESFSLTDSAGRPVLSFAGTRQSATAPLPASAAGQVWRLSAAAKGSYRLDFDLAPLILCPDPETARYIRGSLDVMPDGTICFHKFQVRAWRLLQRYAKLPASAFDVPLPDLKKYKDEWAKEPIRNQLLLGQYGVYANLPVVLKEQNLDPSSPWFGATYVWRDKDGAARMDNPFADCRRARMGNAAPWLPVLAAVYSLDEPLNPLHGHEGLRNRIAVGALRNCLITVENESSIPDKTTYYGGGRAFIYENATMAFPTAVRGLPAEERAVWTEAIERVTDRYAISQVASTCNQWGFIIRGLAQVAAGSDDPWYRTLVLRHVDRLVRRAYWGLGQAEAGYMVESGPDPSYNGHTCSHLAYAWHVTKDDAILESVRRCYDLFNHTIVPEPDGKWLGSSMFSCRTPWDWVGPQGDTGFGMLSDRLPEAGLRAKRGSFLFPVPAVTPEETERAARYIVSRLGYASDDISKRMEDIGRISGSGGAFQIRQFFTTKPKFDVLPVLKGDRFVRSFGNEFFCVRRPAYYAGVYAGCPKFRWQGFPTDPNEQFPRTGGLFLFWTPGFGASILGKNWSAYSAHTLVAEDRTGAKSWEDYWSVKGSLDETASPATLTVTGKMRGLPLEFARRFLFHDDRLEMVLTVKATAAVELASLAEVFPYPTAEIKGAAIAAAITPTAGPAATVSFRVGAKDGHTLQLDPPRPCSDGVNTSVDHYKNTRTYNRVLAALPAVWQAGEERTFRAALAPSAAP